MLEYEKPWLQRMDGRLFGVLLGLTVFVWMFGLGMAVSVLLIGMMLLAGEEFDVEVLMSMIYRAEVLGPTTVVQLLGIGGLVWGAVRVRGKPWRELLGWRAPRGSAWVLALVAGLSIGPFSGWFASVIEQHGGPMFTSEHLMQVAHALTSGPVVPRWILILCVVLGAPLVEELVFRGVVWSALEETLPPVAVWLITSAVFAAYHQNPLHVVALFATSLMLGWVRMATGSVQAAIVAHFANNLVGVGTMYWLGADGDMGLTFPAAAAFLGVSAVACKLMLSRPRDPSPTA